MVIRPSKATLNIDKIERMRAMKQYKEIRKIHANALRRLCINQDWYTAGDNDEYGRALARRRELPYPAR